MNIPASSFIGGLGSVGILIVEGLTPVASGVIMGVRGLAEV